MVALLLILLLGIYTNAQKTIQEKYCWRDYYGSIPSDALALGSDKDGNPVYLGQALHENKLIPGEIYKNSDKINFEWAGTEHSTNQNVKIFCSKYESDFVWINTDNKEIPYLTNTILVNGGYEPTYSTYIGRLEENGAKRLGKVICKADDCIGLILSTPNGQVGKRENFQVLMALPEENK